MDPIRKIPKKFTKKFGNKVINRQYFRRKTGLKSTIHLSQQTSEPEYYLVNCGILNVNKFEFI